MKFLEQGSPLQRSEGVVKEKNHFDGLLFERSRAYTKVFLVIGGFIHFSFFHNLIW